MLIIRVLSGIEVTNYTELSITQEATSCATNQELSNILWNWKLITAFTRALH
jgi:hypothetical protein